MKKTKNNIEKKFQIQFIIQKIENRIIELMTIKGGFILPNHLFRKILNEFPELGIELEILQNRKFKLQRMLFKL